VVGKPVRIAIWTGGSNSPARGRRGESEDPVVLPISALSLPRVSSVVRVRKDRRDGDLRQPVGDACRLASTSFSPTRASSGSINRQKGTVARWCCAAVRRRLSLTIRKSSNAIWVNGGLPAQSPIAHTAGAVVSSLSFTLT